MRLLVLGGTRFLSRAVAEAAVAAGHDVTCACRGSSPVPEGARHLPLDRAADGAAGLADAYDAVVDVATRPAWVRAAVAAVPHAHWVYVSSVSVYADNAAPHGTPADTALLPSLPDAEDPFATPASYGGMKVACEEAVRAAAASVTVVRPGLIVGPGDPSGRFSYWPLRLADPGPVLAPNDPADFAQVLDVRDLAALVLRCAEERLETTLDGVGPVHTMGDLLAEVARGVGAEPELVWVDSRTLLEADVAEWMGPRSLPLWLADPASAGLSARDPRPAEEAGLRCRPVADTAADTLVWLRSDPAAAATGLTRDEEREVLRPLLRP